MPSRRHRFEPWVGKIPWRKERQPIPVFLPRKFHGQRSLVDYNPWGCKESDITEHTCAVFPMTYDLGMDQHLAANSLLLLLSHFSHAQLFVTLWTVAHQAPLSMEFPRQKYWSGLPFPPPGDLSDPGMEPAGLCLLHSQVGSLLLAPPMQILNGSLLGIHRLQTG